MPMKTILSAACLAALAAATATAHHEAASGREYLAFWGAYRLPAESAPTPESCREGHFWQKGFVSIYSVGLE